MVAQRYTIGFVTLESISSYTTELWLGANDCAAHLDVNIITFGGHEKIALSKASPERPYDQVDNLLDFGALDGLLVWTAGILKDHTYAAQFLKYYAAVPTVSLGVDTPGTYRVLMDGYSGMAQLVSHLITTCKRRNIAFITGTLTNRDAQIRQQAYEDTLRQHGLPVRPEFIVPGAFAWNSRTVGMQAICELLDKRGVQPDAIVASSDDLAIGALQELHRRGIHLPEAISVTGFDDIPDCISVYPPLTTVAQPAYELAWRGVEMLLDIIQGKSTPECTVIPTEIVVRHSCGAHLKTTSFSVQALSNWPSFLELPSKAGNEQRLLQEHFTQRRDGYRHLLEKAFTPGRAGQIAYPSLTKVDLVLDSFEQAVLAEEPAFLLNPMQGLVYELGEEGELACWKHGLSALLEQFGLDAAGFYHAGSLAKKSKTLLYLVQIIQANLQFLFEQASSMLKRYQYVQERELVARLQMVSRSLLIPYDPEGLAAIFTEQLPQLGIDLAYVAVRSSFEAQSDDVRLIVLYDQQAKLAEAPANRYYKASALASGRSIIQERRVSLVVIPLYSANIYAGFVIFSLGPRDYQFYMQLGSTLGYSVVNGFLLEQVRTHANQLEGHVEERTRDLRAANHQLQKEIAERIRIEQELEQTRDQALEASRLKSEFLATMSHEIRTPMNGITGMTELLMETELDEEQRSFASVANEESYKLLEIINSILDFSKIEAGKITLEEVEFALADEVQSVIRLLTPKAQNKGIVLLSAIALDVPQLVIGDAVRLRQILMNLVGNAVKFTEMGEVVITIVCASYLPPMPSADGSASIIPLQITVRDTGIGMSETTLQNLFNPFTQADSSTTRRYGGTGLGLAITQRLIQLMGGKLNVLSQLGVGSRFVVMLPYRCQKVTSPTTIKVTGTQALHGLLVSNNSTLCRAITGYLSTWSIQAEIYGEPNSGNGVLLQFLYRLLNRNTPLPCLIIDHQSAKVEPITLARSLRADPLLAKVCLLLVTTNRTSTFHQQLVEAGFDGVLNQPVTQSALYNLLAKRFLAESPLHLLDTENGSTSTNGTIPPALNSGKLLLVVEDYANNQRLILIQLKKLGYAAHIVENGQAAVDAMLNSGDLYQLILMDWQMPVMDGLEATQHIRQAEVKSGRHIPIIGMTANAIKGDRERCLASGMDDYISKPIKRDELRDVLDQWIPA